MYQALYRKWRPKTFADVVGQEHITETLQRQVAEGRLSHAYLFTGTRGTGKTTCAKILARAVNCEHPENGNPCNRCPSCLGIESGRLLDVVELDAASNNGVDSVRALRDEAIYSPAQVKKRVYIVDEVHMLSTPAFNALLKILEEPPEHLMFILATTELHKVPATILSRCQRFSFRRIQPKDIVGRLNYIAGQENIDLKEDGAALLARLSDGALRDALSLLDQCLAFYMGQELKYENVLEVLGAVDTEVFSDFFRGIVAGDAIGLIHKLEKIIIDGRDLSQFVSDFTWYLRNLMLLQSQTDASDVLEMSEENMKLLDEDNREALFKTGNSIYTKIRDDNPTRYINGSKAKNVMVADGCVIEGTVENSILSRGVKIGKNAKVKNCILLQDTVIEDGANLEYVITDKNVRVSRNRSLTGNDSFQVYVAKGQTV